MGMTDRTQRLADEYCRRVVERLRKDPGKVLDKARSNLGTMAPHCHPSFIEAWEKALALPASRLAVILTAARNAQMRRNHPFAGIVSQAERQRILRAVRREAARA
jgi:hypothetical protein